MPNSNGPRSNTRNKLKNEPRQRAVEEYEAGEKVHLKIDPSTPEGRFHPRFDGRTGEVTGKQGTAYTVAVSDGSVQKTLIVKAAHLRRQD
jgi:large subunit ribosomal protein L21e